MEVSAATPKVHRAVHKHRAAHASPPPRYLHAALVRLDARCDHFLKVEPRLDGRDGDVVGVRRLGRRARLDDPTPHAEAQHLGLRVEVAAPARVSWWGWEGRGGCGGARA